MSEEQLKKIFRPVTLLEGISLILLFFFAMPLKYLYDTPEYVKVIGWIHGILFIAFMMLLAIARIWFKWSLRKTGLFFIAALIPFMAFYVDKKYLR